MKVLSPAVAAQNAKFPCARVEWSRWWCNLCRVSSMLTKYGSVTNDSLKVSCSLRGAQCIAQTTPSMLPNASSLHCTTFHNFAHCFSRLVKLKGKIEIMQISLLFRLFCFDCSKPAPTLSCPIKLPHVQITSSKFCYCKFQFFSMVFLATPCQNTTSSRSIWTTAQPRAANLPELALEDPLMAVPSNVLWFRFQLMASSENQRFCFR